MGETGQIYGLMRWGIELGETVNEFPCLLIRFVLLNLLWCWSSRGVPKVNFIRTEDRWMKGRGVKGWTKGDGVDEVKKVG